MTICKEKANNIYIYFTMPSLLVPQCYHVLDKDHGGWLELSKMTKGSGQCWTGDKFCHVNVRKVKTEDTRLLLLDAVTLFGEGEGTGCLNVCYIWQPPPLLSDQPSYSPTCFLRDHEVLAFRDFARKKRDINSVRDYFILPRNRCDHFSFIPRSLFKHVGHSRVIYDDDLPCQEQKLCEKCMDRCGQLHLRHYVDVAIGMKGHNRPATRGKSNHIEIVDAHLPMSSWRRLRRTVSVCGMTNMYSFKVREIHPSHGLRKRRVRLRFSSKDLKSMIKENLPHVDTITSVSNKTKVTITWSEITWDENDSETMIVEGIQIWPKKH